MGRSYTLLIRRGLGGKHSELLVTKAVLGPHQGCKLLHNIPASIYWSTTPLSQHHAPRSTTPLTAPRPSQHCILFTVGLFEPCLMTSLIVTELTLFSYLFHILLYFKLHSRSCLFSYSLESTLWVFLPHSRKDSLKTVWLTVHHPNSHILVLQLPDLYKLN